MSPPKGEEVSSQPSEIVPFFSGKSVFITGAAGYLGAVLLEILLRCCPDIRRIYILLRPKKGVLPQDRKESIFKKAVFSKVKEKNPDVCEKVIVVAGDITRDNLGMSDEDLHTVIQEVSIVYHCAASISFFKPLRYMLLYNVIATINVIEFCRKLKKLDALVYTSTAYSNSNRMEIEEKIYELPFSTEEVIDHFRNNRDAELMHLFSLFKPKFPNFYVFTKCLAEKVLQDKAYDIPVAIVRPSIITCAWKGALPGYVEEGSGLFNLCVGIGKGFIRVLRVDTSQQMDSVPVDTVANSHIAAAWSQATQRLPSPSVYNCVSTPFNSFNWGELVSCMFKMAELNPLPNSYQKPGLACYKSSVPYWFHAILDHYMPCIVIDTLLWLSGRTPRLFKLYRFYDKAMLAILPFTTRSWKFDCGNYKNLVQKLNNTDAEIFPYDLRDYTPQLLTKVLPTGAPIYQWESDKKSFKERMRASYMHYLLTTCIKWSLLGTVVLSLYMIIF